MGRSSRPHIRIILRSNSMTNLHLVLTLTSSSSTVLASSAPVCGENNPRVRDSSMKRLHGMRSTIQIWTEHQSSVLGARVISPSINATSKTVVITSGNQEAFRISCGVLACVWRFGQVFWLHKIFLANAITKLKFANSCFLMFAQVLRTVGS